MSENKNKDSKSDDATGSVICLLIASGLFYGGGWGIYEVQTFFENSSWIMIENGIAIRINNDYFGVGFSDRFFDSPVLSLLCGAAGLFMTFIGLVAALPEPEKKD